MPGLESLERKNFDDGEVGLSPVSLLNFPLPFDSP
jgi:hypothetical protein